MYICLIIYGYWMYDKDVSYFISYFIIIYFTFFETGGQMANANKQGSYFAFVKKM